MAAIRERELGRFKVEVELANYEDLAAVRLGVLKSDKVRRMKVLGVVDSGASGLVLPTSLAKQLGFPVTGKVKVIYANRQSTRRDKVEGVYLEFLGRHGVFDAHLAPRIELNQNLAALRRLSMCPVHFGETDSHATDTTGKSSQDKPKPALDGAA